VPGSESAPNLAPQPLDHFKRGYRERADQRDRETGMLNGDIRRQTSNSEHQGGGGGSFQGQGNRNSSSSEQRRGGGGDNHQRHGHRDSNASGRGSFYDSRRSSNNGDRGDDRGGRGQVIMGLDVQALVDRLCRNNTDVFRELDGAREEHLSVFQSGKAVTAIISNLARRRNLRLASSVWEWIDSVGIKKNTFHYNSMISVCEKVRDFKKALRLLDEMKEKGVAKNEVTYVFSLVQSRDCMRDCMRLIGVTHQFLFFQFLFCHFGL
jgi:pentatricopeptide repeat protein